MSTLANPHPCRVCTPSTSFWSTSRQSGRKGQRECLVRSFCLLLHPTPHNLKFNCVLSCRFCQRTACPRPRHVTRLIPHIIGTVARRRVSWSKTQPIAFAVLCSRGGPRSVIFVMLFSPKVCVLFLRLKQRTERTTSRSIEMSFLAPTLFSG